ncbi:MAG: HAD-IA family hydrolase [Clostridia bacterium]|nr:HAD-IA family hydrolase [Clostridia bacterium]
MFKNILFDFDGTLVDTNDLIIFSLNEVAKSFMGRCLTKDELNSILGKYLDDQMKMLSEVHYKEMVLQYKECYKSNQDKMIKEFPHIREMLRKLKDMGCRTAIVSAKGRGGIEHGLDFFNIREYIDVIISAYDIENNKPHPEPALKALSALNAQPEGSILVGDSPYDVLCGINAGIKTALVSWTIFPKESFQNIKPDYIIDTPMDLIDIIQE